MSVQACEQGIRGCGGETSLLHYVAEEGERPGRDHVPVEEWSIVSPNGVRVDRGGG